MESEENRSDDYWMGVRDALRMVDSFLKWSNANKDRAKPLEDFLYDGLVAAAKRCESCLHKQLGIGFASGADDSPEEEPTFDSMPPADEPSIDEDIVDSPPEIVLEPEGSDIIAEVPLEIEPESPPEDGSVRIEAMGATDESHQDDLISGEHRDFSDDFRLVEPDSLVISSGSDGIETPEPTEDTLEPESEDIVIDDTDDDSVEESTPEVPPPEDEEISVERPKYAWESPTEFQDALEGPPPVPEIPPSDDSSEEPISEPKVWSPMDDPSPDTLVDEDSNESDEDETQPPPPPPPPESEESEEERRRRARRLFFGA